MSAAPSSAPLAASLLKTAADGKLVLRRQMQLLLAAFMLYLFTVVLPL